MTKEELEQHDDIIDFTDNDDAKDIKISTIIQPLDLACGSKEMGQFLDALRDKNLNKPGAFESVMANIVNHIWNHNYKPIFMMVFFLRLMPFICQILLWNNICNFTLILNIV